MARGVFITLEGGEGVGKSTLLEGLAAELTNKGLEVVQTREPGGSRGAEALRGLVLSPPDGVAWTPLAQTLLFNAARRDHLDTLIGPALNRGAWVVCDRFADSTRAYQAAAGGLSKEDVSAIEAVTVGDMQPDLTLILDMPVSAAAERRDARGGPMDVFEAKGADFHDRVRHAFLNIAAADPKRCRVLSADQPRQEVLNAALDAVEACFPGSHADPS